MSTSATPLPIDRTLGQLPSHAPLRSEPRFALVVETDDAPAVGRGATFLVARRDLLRLLENGAADDLVVVPCREAPLPEATHAATALPRAAADAQGDVLRVGTLDVDRVAREARVEGRSIELTRREFDLLVFFCQNQGRAVRREELLAEVWRTPRLDMQRTIDIHVRRLRAKLGSAFSLDTVYRVGYRFRAPRPSHAT